MPSRSRTRLPGWIDRLYARLLRAYPAAFQEDYESEMRSAFRARWRDERDQGGLLGVARLTAAMLLDIVRTAPREHLDMLIHDVRYAWRSLSRRQNWSFSLAAILTLGLGIGAVTAIFSILYAVLLAPMPYREGDRVVRVFETNLSKNIPTFAASIPNFADWQTRAHSFSGLAAIGDASVNLTGSGTPERVQGLTATANLFEVLGMAPVAGRAFLPEDDLPGHAHIILIGTSLWRRQFASDPAVVGRSIGVDGVAHTIVGVVPQDVGFTTDVDVWLPLAPEPAKESRGNHRVAVIGRLAPGVSIAAAEAEMNQVAAAIEQDNPGPEKGWRAKVVSVRDWIVSPTLRQRLNILFVAVTLLLFVACINVANLQLARATGRLREIGVRVALGASRARLVRQMITENLLLASVGGSIGVALAWFSIGLAKASLPESIPRLATLSLNLPVLLVAIAAIGTAALIAGLVPATLIARANVADVNTIPVVHT